MSITTFERLTISFPFSWMLMLKDRRGWIDNDAVVLTCNFGSDCDRCLFSCHRSPTSHPRSGKLKNDHVKVWSGILSSSCDESYGKSQIWKFSSFHTPDRFHLMVELSLHRPYITLICFSFLCEGCVCVCVFVYVTEHSLVRRKVEHWLVNNFFDEMMQCTADKWTVITQRKQEEAKNKQKKTKHESNYPTTDSSRWRRCLLDAARCRPLAAIERGVNDEKMTLFQAARFDLHLLHLAIIQLAFSYGLV